MSNSCSRRVQLRFLMFWCTNRGRASQKLLGVVLKVSKGLEIGTRLLGCGSLVFWGGSLAFGWSLEIQGVCV